MKPGQVGSAIKRAMKRAEKAAATDSIRRVSAEAKRQVMANTGMKAKAAKERTVVRMNKERDGGSVTVLVGLIPVSAISHKVARRNKRTYVSVTAPAKSFPLPGAFKAKVKGGSAGGIFQRGAKGRDASWDRGRRLWLPISSVTLKLSDIMDAEGLNRDLQTMMVTLFKELFSKKFAAFAQAAFNSSK